jgi:hypothetical protein
LGESQFKAFILLYAWPKHGSGRGSRNGFFTYDPDVPGNEEHLCVGREERHPCTRTSLFLILRVYPRPAFTRFSHAPESFRMVHKRLIESLCERRISDICADNTHNIVRSVKGPATKDILSWLPQPVRTIMCRTYPTSCNHKVVLLNHASACLNSSTQAAKALPRHAALPA